MLPLNEMLQPVGSFVSLLPPSSAVLLTDPQWTSSNEDTCSQHEDNVTLVAALGV